MLLSSDLSRGAIKNRSSTGYHPSRKITFRFLHYLDFSLNHLVVSSPSVSGLFFPSQICSFEIYPKLALLSRMHFKVLLHCKIAWKSSLKRRTSTVSVFPSSKTSKLLRPLQPHLTSPLHYLWKVFWKAPVFVAFHKDFPAFCVSILYTLQKRHVLKPSGKSQAFRGPAETVPEQNLVLNHL